MYMYMYVCMYVCMYTCMYVWHCMYCTYNVCKHTYMYMYIHVVTVQIAFSYHYQNLFIWFTNQVSITVGIRYSFFYTSTLFTTATLTLPSHFAYNPLPYQTTTILMFIVMFCMCGYNYRHITISNNHWSSNLWQIACR